MKAIIFDFNRTLFDPEEGILISGSVEVLRKLAQNKKLALITTDLGKRDYLIKKLGIEQFFKKIIVTKYKNEQDFLVCCKALKVKPNQVIVVGDRVKGEIMIGNKLGMLTVQYLNGPFAKELPADIIEKPKIIIRRLEDLLQILTDLK